VEGLASLRSCGDRGGRPARGHTFAHTQRIQRDPFTKQRGEKLMNMTTILIILVVLLVLGGGWGYSRRGRRL